MSADSELITTNLPVNLYTYIYDKDSNQCISAPSKENNHFGYYFREWDVKTKWGCVSFLEGDRLRLTPDGHEVIFESIYFPNAKTVFRVSEKIAAEIEAIQDKNYTLESDAATYMVSDVASHEIANLLKLPDTELEIKKEKV